MYAAYKLNTQGDNIQLWCTLFPIWKQSFVPYLIITVSSWLAYRFLRRQVGWFSIPISLGIFHSLIYISCSSRPRGRFSTFHTHQRWKQQFQSQGSVKSLFCFYTSADFYRQDLDDEVTCVVWWTRWYLDPRPTAHYLTFEFLQNQLWKRWLNAPCKFPIILI